MLNDVIQRILRDSPVDRCEVVFGSGSHQTQVSVGPTQPTGALPVPWLVASLTKPVVAFGFLKLVARGLVSTSDRIRDVLPMFQAAAFRRITFHHLLTHSSGLPDTVPRNVELRDNNACLKEFLQETTTVELISTPGQACQYSSIGFLLLGAAIQQVAGCGLQEYLKQDVFDPVGMQNTWLGIESDYDRVADRIPRCGLPIWQQDADQWGWNSRYWRCLGAPWGGLIASAEDMAQFAKMILRQGITAAGQPVVGSAVIQASLANQTRHISTNGRDWGLGWRRQWNQHHASFGDFVSPDTVGHWGATGTLLWIDPSKDRFAVILTSTPFEESRATIQRVSNVIAAVDSIGH